MPLAKKIKKKVRRLKINFKNKSDPDKRDYYVINKMLLLKSWI